MRRSSWRGDCPLQRASDRRGTRRPRRLARRPAACSDPPSAAAARPASPPPPGDRRGSRGAPGHPPRRRRRRPPPADPAATRARRSRRHSVAATASARSRRAVGHHQAAARRAARRWRATFTPVAPAPTTTTWLSASGQLTRHQLHRRRGHRLRADAEGGLGADQAAGAQRRLHHAAQERAGAGRGRRARRAPGRGSRLRRAPATRGRRRRGTDGWRRRCRTGSRSSAADRPPACENVRVTVVVVEAAARAPVDLGAIAGRQHERLDAGGRRARRAARRRASASSECSASAPMPTVRWLTVIARRAFRPRSDGPDEASRDGGGASEAEN